MTSPAAFPTFPAASPDLLASSTASGPASCWSTEVAASRDADTAVDALERMPNRTDHEISTSVYQTQNVTKNSPISDSTADFLQSLTNLLRHWPGPIPIFGLLIFILFVTGVKRTRGSRIIELRTSVSGAGAFDLVFYTEQVDESFADRDTCASDGLTSFGYGGASGVADGCPDLV